MIEVKSERLSIIPLANDELKLLIEQYKNVVPELSLAYQEMLENCVRYPSQAEWYTAWKINLINNGENIGYAGFKGFNNGSPEIGYGINDEYTRNGYATEAVNALCKWAMSNPDVIAIEAETEAGNIASIKVLSKNGFIESGAMGEEGPRYILKR